MRAGPRKKDKGGKIIEIDTLDAKKREMGEKDFTR